MPPEKTSWKISTKGMTVIAAVVLCASEDTHRESMSEAYVIRNMDTKSSR